MGLGLRRIILWTVAIALLGAAPAAAQIEAPGAAAPEAAEETVGDVPAAAGTPTSSEGTELSGEQGAAGPPVRDARVRLRIGGLRHGKLTVGKRFKAKGTLAPFVKGERVTLIVRRGGKTIKRKVVTPKRKKGANFSKFRISQRKVRPGHYSVQAIHKRSDKLSYAQDRSRKFRIRYPSLREGNRSKTVRLFNHLLARLGYVNDEGKKFDSASARAVLAFRKVNGMSRNFKASSKIFKKLAKGKGGYKLRYPGSGKHVEIDLSRQVMVLAKGGKVKEIYHVSTGSPATPTPPGTWRFYRKEPGYNNKAMYYSVYWNRGYATHGYHDVPTYPASHGCARNPIPDAHHIYNWIDLGDLIHIYP